eukprot:1178691-Prorocentrum_minimum.AAC.1
MKEIRLIGDIKFIHVRQGSISCCCLVPCFAVQDLACRLTLDATSPGVDCRPANDSPPTGNIRRIFYGIFEMSCAEWYTSVDSQRLSTVELKSKAFLAVDSGA